MDLFLNEEVPVAIKKIVGDRMRDVEKEFSAKRANPPPFVGNYPVVVPDHPDRNPSGYTAAIPQANPSYGAPVYIPIQDGSPPQAPSMQRIIQANPDIIKPPVPVTPAAAAALQQRAKLMQGALNEKPEEGRNSPRKF